MNPDDSTPLDDIIEAVDERRDDYTWPLLCVERAKEELTRLRARVAALEKACEAGDALLLVAREHCDNYTPCDCYPGHAQTCSTHFKFMPAEDAYRAARESSRE